MVAARLALVSCDPGTACGFGAQVGDSQPPLKWQDMGPLAEMQQGNWKPDSDVWWAVVVMNLGLWPVDLGTMWDTVRGVP